MRSLMVRTPHQYCSSDQTEMNEMVGHIARIGESRGVYRVWWGNLREREHLEDPGVDGRIILRWIFRRGIGMNELDQSG